MKTDNIPANLRWACRRGMLELDVLLGKFLEEAYSNLQATEQANFVNLLSQSDQDLFNWLTGKTPCPDQNLSNMIEKVREHAKNRH
jgi:antitoxin CptB